jgi:hypothetical protein
MAENSKPQKLAKRQEQKKEEPRDACSKGVFVFLLFPGLSRLLAQPASTITASPASPATR